MKKIVLLLTAILCCAVGQVRTQPMIAPAAATPVATAATPAAGGGIAVTAAASPTTAAVEKPDAAIAVGDTKQAPADSAVNKKTPVRVPRFDVAPNIDGILDDQIWQRAFTFRDFVQTSPGDNVPPSKPTEAMIGYDERTLYLAFRAFDEPDKVRATVAKRDEVLGEDNVRVYLDTYDDQRRAYVIAFNPLGVQQDGIYTEGQGTDYSFDIVMTSKGVMTETGWTLEVAIPFKSLRYAAGKGKLWGIHLQRNIDRFNDELDSWVPINRNNQSLLVQAGKITGFEDIKFERTLELVPSVTLRQTGERDVRREVANGSTVIEPRFLQKGIARDIGLTSKFVLTPNITLDAAINPDFAEVEADAAVVTANQRFPIFFPELRPFFLEGIDIFNSPLNIVYTRTIQNPDVAAKLTGKIGKNVFGILAAHDNVLGSDDNAIVGVARVRRDVGRQNFLGVFSTARIYQDSISPSAARRNFVSGVDGRFVLTPKLTFEFQTVGSHSRRRFYNPDLDRSQYRTGNGLAYSYELDYTERDRGWVIQGSGASRDYRADVGFVGRTNTNRIFYATRLSTAPKPKNRIIRANWNTFGEIRYNWQGRSQEGFLGTGVNFSLQRNTGFGVEGGASYERLFEDEFGARRNANQSGAFVGASERSSYQPYTSVFFNSQPSQKVTLSGNFSYSLNAYDFDFGAGNRFQRASQGALEYYDSPEYQEYLRRRREFPYDNTIQPPDAPALDPGTGRSLSYGASIALRPTSPFRISLNYRRSTLTRDDTKRTAFDSNIFTLRSTYQFTKFTFVRARWDYFTDTGNVNGQLLLGYNPNPGTAFYVGYNDNFNYNGYNPFTGFGEPRFERNSRTFFIRATYLIRRGF